MTELSRRWTIRVAVVEPEGHMRMCVRVSSPAGERNEDENGRESECKGEKGTDRHLLS